MLQEQAIAVTLRGDAALGEVLGAVQRPSTRQLAKRLGTPGQRVDQFAAIAGRGGRQRRWARSMSFLNSSVHKRTSRLRSLGYGGDWSIVPIRAGRPLTVSAHSRPRRPSANCEPLRTPRFVDAAPLRRRRSATSSVLRTAWSAQIPGCCRRAVCCRCRGSRQRAQHAGLSSPGS
jgi:hypothetical protein